ncbi:unnamed protein product [Dovyalis caffra]|uniref:Uncharacterized protein n=1 Tax=Dovyalis caffra TaxID=77055 RepID=A0AAV1RWX4_9ROSI|nr:unnamed protein product [Dovyalis caffra]
MKFKQHGARKSDKDLSPISTDYISATHPYKSSTPLSQQNTPTASYIKSIELPSASPINRSTAKTSYLPPLFLPIEAEPPPSSLYFFPPKPNHHHYLFPFVL